MTKLAGANQTCHYLIIVSQFHEVICFRLDRVLIHPGKDPMTDLFLKGRK